MARSEFRHPEAANRVGECFAIGAGLCRRKKPFFLASQTFSETESTQIPAANLGTSQAARPNGERPDAVATHAYGAWCARVGLPSILYDTTALCCESQCVWEWQIFGLWQESL